MAWRNLWSDLGLIFILTKLRLCAHKLFVKWVPECAHFQSQLVNSDAHWLSQACDPTRLSLMLDSQPRYLLEIVYSMSDLVWGRSESERGPPQPPPQQQPQTMSRICIIVRRAGLLWSQQDFEWWWSVPLSSASLYYSFLLFCLICVY